jgi:hypothetical protein
MTKYFGCEESSTRISALSGIRSSFAAFSQICPSAVLGGLVGLHGDIFPLVLIV